MKNTPHWRRWGLLEIAAVSTLIGCSLFRWKGHPSDVPNATWASADVKTSTGPARGRPQLPPFDPSKHDDVEYYSDLGPGEIDVSGYPTQQKYNYALVKQACGGCHPMARTVNSPVQSRTYWHFHLVRMNLHMRLSGSHPLSPRETKSVLDFLEYDAKVRKVEHHDAFEAQNDELRRRYDLILENRLERLQKGDQPQLIRDR